MPRREPPDHKHSDLWARFIAGSDRSTRGELLEAYLPFLSLILARIGPPGGDGRLKQCAIEALAESVDHFRERGPDNFESFARRRISKAICRSVSGIPSLRKQMKEATQRVDDCWEKLRDSGSTDPDQFLGEISRNPREALDLLYLARLNSTDRDLLAKPQQLADLNGEEKDTLGLLFGEELMTHDEVAVASNLKKSRVLAIEGMILARLRRPLMQSEENSGESSSGVRTIAITSGKGGVGKTQVSVGLSIEWARQGHRVLLIDCDLGLANVELLFGIQPKKTLQHHIAGACSLDEVLAEIPQHSWGAKGGTPGGKLVILPGASGVTDLADLGREALDRLLGAFEELSTRFDLLLFDTGAGIADQVRRFCHFAGEVVVVTNREPLARKDAYSLIKALSIENPELRFWLVSNLARGSREGAEVHQLIAEMSKRRFQQDVQFAGSIPEDAQVQRAVDNNSSVMMFDPRSSAARAIEGISQEILGSQGEDDEDFLTRLKRFF